MPLVITRGLGDFGDGSKSSLVATQGYGRPGISDCVAFIADGLLAFDEHLVVSFNEDIGSVSGPAALASGYYITLVGAGDPVAVLSVSYENDELTLQTTRHTFGAHYTLHMPFGGLLSASSKPFSGPFELNYLGGSGVDVLIQLTRSLDARTIEVVFNRAVDDDDASDPRNYSVSPFLGVHAAIKQSDFHYRLTTDQQAIGETYTVSIDNIRGK